jgi:hypothetical protein
MRTKLRRVSELEDTTKHLPLAYTGLDGASDILAGVPIFYAFGTTLLSMVWLVRCHWSKQLIFAQLALATRHRHTAFRYSSHNAISAYVPAGFPLVHGEIGRRSGQIDVGSTTGGRQTHYLEDLPSPSNELAPSLRRATIARIRQTCTTVLFSRHPWSRRDWRQSSNRSLLQHRKRPYGRRLHHSRLDDCGRHLDPRRTNGEALPALQVLGDWIHYATPRSQHASVGSARRFKKEFFNVLLGGLY